MLNCHAHSHTWIRLLEAIPCILWRTDTEYLLHISTLLRPYTEHMHQQAHTCAHAPSPANVRTSYLQAYCPRQGVACVYQSRTDNNSPTFSYPYYYYSFTLMQQHRFTYNEPMTVESTTQSLCDLALRFGEDDEDGGMVRVALPALLPPL